MPSSLPLTLSLAFLGVFVSPILALVIQFLTRAESPDHRPPFVPAALLTAFGFAIIAWFRAPLEPTIGFVVHVVWWGLLVVIALVDLRTFQIPDVLSLPATIMLLSLPLVLGGVGLPSVEQAFVGATFGAGLLTFINRVGGLALRRGKDTRERLWPLGFDQANLAAVVGALAGPTAGILAAVASVLLNLVTQRTLRIPEPYAWLAWLAALFISPLTVGLLPALLGSLVACGSLAMLGAFAWWVHDLMPRKQHLEPDILMPNGEEEGADEPVAMGFGDAKLAALIGVLTGWQGIVIAFFAAAILGSIIGVAQRWATRDRAIPFGPYLASGALIALVASDELISAYLRALGLA